MKGGVVRAGRAAATLEMCLQLLGHPGSAGNTRRYWHLTAGM